MRCWAARSSLTGTTSWFAPTAAELPLAIRWCHRRTTEGEISSSRANSATVSSWRTTRAICFCLNSVVKMRDHPIPADTFPSDDPPLRSQITLPKLPRRIGVQSTANSLDADELRGTLPNRLTPEEEKRLRGLAVAAQALHLRLHLLPRNTVRSVERMQQNL